MTNNDDNALFPALTRDYILAFQFSSWYPIFAAHSIKSTIIRPLSSEFREYLDADGVFVPEGSEDAPAESTLSDDENNADEAKDEDESRSDDESDDEDDEDTRRKHYAFPELDAHIRECIKTYDAVFPKLNFTSPRDAAWLLPASSPLKCTSPADVYLLLKSSDFITHDLSPEAVFEGTSGSTSAPSDAAASSPEEPSARLTERLTDSKTEPYELELVLRKWYPVDRSRELRCFVRDGVFLAISQRDTNFYEFWNEPDTQDRVRRAVREFWETHIQPKWPTAVTQDYIFDLLLTRDLARGHIVDFNPYAPKTDPLLFSYEELAALRRNVAHRDIGEPTSGEREREDGAGEDQSSRDQDKDAREKGKEPGPASQSQSQARVHEPLLPVLRVIDSAAHPAAASNAPAHQHNMIPFEAVSLSSGRDIEEFADTWQASVKESMRDD